MTRLKKVRPAGRFALELEWRDGRKQRADLAGLVAASRHFRRFAEHPAEFAQVAAVNWGHGIAWKNGLDYAAENLARIADEQAEASGAEEIKRFQEHFELTNAEAGAVFGYKPSQIKNFRSGAWAVPKPVLIALREMRRDPTLFHAHFARIARARRKDKPPRPRTSPRAAA